MQLDGIYISVVLLCSLLVSQRSSEVVLNVGVHHRSEVVETAVPEQVDDKNLHRARNNHVNPTPFVLQSCKMKLCV